MAPSQFHQIRCTLGAVRLTVLSGATVAIFTISALSPLVIAAQHTDSHAAVLLVHDPRVKGQTAEAGTLVVVTYPFTLGVIERKL